MFRLLTIYMCILLTVIITSCDLANTSKSFTVLAKVDDDILTLEEMRETFGASNWERMKTETQKEHINQWINMTLIANLAKQDEEISSNPAVKFTAKNAEKKIYTNAIIAKRLNAMKITEEELYNYYRLHQAEFVQSSREFKVQRMFFRTEEEMRRVRAMLDARQVRFNGATEQFSQEPIGRNGGYMNGFVTQAGPDSLLWKELNKREKWAEVNMRYEGGWIIARYYDDREGSHNRSFFDVKEEIEKKMKAEKQNDLYNQILREARYNSIVTHEY